MIDVNWQWIFSIKRLIVMINHKFDRWLICCTVKKVGININIISTSNSKINFEINN